MACNSIEHLNNQQDFRILLLLLIDSQNKRNPLLIWFNVVENEFNNYTEMDAWNNFIEKKFNATVRCCHLTRNRPRCGALF